MTAKNIQLELDLLANSNKAKNLSRFFKTGKGEYGEGDIFIGVMVPNIRIIAQKYTDLPLIEIQKLIGNKIHEYRLTALLILTYKYPKADKILKKQIVNFYQDHMKFINNWDLVDLSSPKILGDYSYNYKNTALLYKLVKSDNLWFRRIAILATFTFIRNNSFDDALKIAKLLLNDEQDLIHKAMGWMLREIGKRDEKAEKDFLLKYHQSMPRTMLRYAIERFDKENREFFLKKEYN